jgi:3-methyladenine DNA glycosylase AlkD
MDLEALRKELYGGRPLAEAVTSKMVGTALPWMRIPVPKIKGVVKGSLLDPSFNPLALPFAESVEMQQLFFWSALAQAKTFRQQMVFLRRYLQKANSWMVTDGCPQYLRQAPVEDFYPFYAKMVASPYEYERRFAYVLALRYARLDPTFFLNKLRYDDHYYVYMAEAWLLATMAIWHEEAVLAFLARKETPLPLLRKTVSKMQDSFRIPSEEKKRAKQLLAKR